MVISVKRCCCTVKCLLRSLEDSLCTPSCPGVSSCYFLLWCLVNFCFLSARVSSDNDLVTNNTCVSFGTKRVQALAWKVAIPSQGIAALWSPLKFLLSVTRTVLKPLSSDCNKLLSQEKDRI